MYLEDYSCVFCSLGYEEDLFYLLLVQLEPDRSQLFRPRMFVTKLQNSALGSFFMEVIITMCWAIWTMRNDAIFRNLAPSLQRCNTVFKQEFALVILRAKSKYLPFIVQWLEAFM
jgi:hypothetical protein